MFELELGDIETAWCLFAFPSKPGAKCVDAVHNMTMVIIEFMFV